MSFQEWFTTRGDAQLGAKIKAATDMHLTDIERAKTRDFLLAYTRMHPAKARVQRPRRASSLFFPAIPVFALSLLVIIGGTAGAAELALPGDMLYPIKVNVIEEVRAAIATTPEKKAVVALARAEERIKELETLETRGNVDDKILEETQERIDVQIRAAEEKSLETRDDNGERGSREQRLVAVLRAHEHLINRGQEPMGGSLAPDVPLEEVIAFASTPEAANAPTPEATSMAMMAGAAPEPANEPEVAARTTAQAPEEDAVVQNIQNMQNVQKKNISTLPKNIARQKKAAEQRVDALQKFIKKLEERASADALSQAQLALQSAQQFLSDGEVALSGENTTEASFLLNKALKTAIDARETLNDAKKSNDDKEREEKDEDEDRRGRDRDSKSQDN